MISFFSVYSNWSALVDLMVKSEMLSTKLYLTYELCIHIQYVLSEKVKKILLLRNIAWLLV